jgi:hypothetical protein
MDRRGLRAPDSFERDGLMGIAAEAADLKLGVAGVEGVAERRRWLRRALEGEHALGPGITGEFVGLLARFSGALSCHSDRGAVQPVAEFGAHGEEDARGWRGIQAATI